ncbi:hypothetical protein IAR55_006616 [Kwoniella newhampshirensis]|uniref:Uncharacterized protein n=1 Tax=Kwoniella newhampshirensis TaxID=1651941 RepID=A0AAW0YTK9_9TREE
MPASPRPIDHSNSPSEGSLPSTPPPSLAYTRTTLLSLLPPTPPIPQPRRLSSFTPILRISNTLDESQWGVDESEATLFDDQPISKVFPIPPLSQEGVHDILSLSIASSQDDTNTKIRGERVYPADRKSIWRRGSGSSTTSSGKFSDDEVLFHFASPSVGQEKRQVLVDFTNPFARIVEKLKNNLDTEIGTGTDTDSNTFSSSNKMDGLRGGEIDAWQGLRARSDNAMRRPSASSVFQLFPSSVNSSSTSLHIPSTSKPFLSRVTNQIDPISSLGEAHHPPRRGLPSSRSSSISSSSSTEDRSLNPCAPPFRFSNTLPPSSHPPPLPVPRTSNFNVPASPSLNPTTPVDTPPSLPLPKPASLPARPPGPLPPVFVKRESAALPQPMALPDVAPLGEGWEGENSLSGNDKRRRASESGLPPLPIAAPIQDPKDVDASGTKNRMGGTRKTSHVGSGRSSPTPSFTQSLGNEPRPERLVRLGQKLRASLSPPGRSTSVKA